MDGRDAQESAKSDDRDAALDLIDRAHAEGRIGSADRTIRKNNVATAATLGELEMITRDLVFAPAEPVAAEPLVEPPQQPEPVPAPAPAPARYDLPPQAYMTPRRVVVHGRTGATAMLGVVAALVGLSIAASVFLTNVGLPDFEFEQPDPTVQVDDQYALDEEGFRWLLGRYRGEFGTTVAMRAVFYDSYAIFEVPSEDGRPEHTGWMYSAGTFRVVTRAQVNAADTVAVNLKRVDYAALARSLDLARRTLGVEDGEVTHVIVADDPFAGRPTATIYVTNQVGASGFLVTDLRGEVLRSFPWGG